MANTAQGCPVFDWRVAGMCCSQSRLGNQRDAQEKERELAEKNRRGHSRTNPTQVRARP